MYKAYKQINIIIICKYTLCLFLKEASYAHPWHIYLLKNTVILFNTIFKITISILIYIKMQFIPVLARLIFCIITSIFKSF